MPSLIAVPDRIAKTDFRARALAIWPGLDREKLRRTHGDPVRIARLVEHRTRLSLEAIVSLLTGQPLDDGGEKRVEG
jgi:hypothetical protein